MDAAPQSKVEVVAPSSAQFAQATTTPTREQAVVKDQSSAADDEKKKKPWYKRIKLQPVIYRGKCGI
ncbi:hypothetical protein Gpo141_00009620 [Globisporangium polare]